MLMLDDTASLKEEEKLIEVNSCGKFSEKCFLLKLCIKAYSTTIFKRSTFYPTFDTFKANIKFIVLNLWIRIYDKDSFRVVHDEQHAHTTRMYMSIIIGRKD